MAGQLEGSHTKTHGIDGEQLDNLAKHRAPGGSNNHLKYQETFMSSPQTGGSHGVRVLRHEADAVISLGFHVFHRDWTMRVGSREDSNQVNQRPGEGLA